MGDILGVADFEMVRKLAHVDSTTIDDVVLGSFIYLDTVEAFVKDGITDWETIMDSPKTQNAVLLRSGTAHLLAAKVGGELRASTTYAGGFRVGGYSETASQVDWNEVEARLLRKAAEALAGISTRDHTRQTVALASGPTSSKANVPSTYEQWYERIQPRYLDWIQEGGQEDDTLIP